MQIFSQNGPWSVPNKQNPSFYSIFHAFSRSRSSPDWPVPIPGPYMPFLAITHRYRPSITPTCSSNFALPNFFEIFSRYSQLLYKTHTQETRFSSLPIVFFHIQHVNPPDNRINFTQKRQDMTRPSFYMRFPYVSKQKKLKIYGCRFNPQTK